MWAQLGAPRLVCATGCGVHDARVEEDQLTSLDGCTLPCTMLCSVCVASVSVLEHSCLLYVGGHPNKRGVDKQTFATRLIWVNEMGARERERRIGQVDEAEQAQDNILGIHTHTAAWGGAMHDWW